MKNKSVKNNMKNKDVKNNDDKKNAVKNLICHIKVMYYNNDPMLNSVDDVNMLYNALCDLNEIVGMYEVKNSIVKQIKFLLVNCANTDKSKFENHMLHTVVFGPPGVGKTTVGSCLSNIWKGLGLIEKKKIGDKGHKNQQNGRGIRILPIPIFLIKEKENKDNDESDTRKESDEESKKLENNIKTYLSGHNDEKMNTTSSEKDNRYTNDNKYLSIKRKKHEKHSNQDICFLSELKESDENMHRRDKQDDMKAYVKDLIESHKLIRDQNLLKFGIKNLTKLSDNLNSKPLLKRTKMDAPIKIVSRPDFVGQYVGHTCDKTQKLLSSTLEEGKVLFIDEAYSIVLDEKDSFGHEALNELNRFMSEHPELVVIFAGYKDKIENTLFKYQPGFKRRCTWIFEISNYTGEMLTDIFKKQLSKDGWKYGDSDGQLTDFFNRKIKHFESFGGDTVRMALYCKLKYSEIKFDYNLSDKLEDKTITYKIFENAYENLYCKNKPEIESIEQYLHSTMYI